MRTRSDGGVRATNYRHGSRIPSRQRSAVVGLVALIACLAGCGDDDETGAAPTDTTVAELAEGARNISGTFYLGDIGEPELEAQWTVKVRQESDQWCLSEMTIDDAELIGADPTCLSTSGDGITDADIVGQYKDADVIASSRRDGANAPWARSPTSSRLAPTTPAAARASWPSRTPIPSTCYWQKVNTPAPMWRSPRTANRSPSRLTSDHGNAQARYAARSIGSDSREKFRARSFSRVNQCSCRRSRILPLSITDLPQVIGGWFGFDRSHSCSGSTSADGCTRSAAM